MSQALIRNFSTATTRPGVDSRNRTRPAPGNHEYKSGNADGYFNYFGAAAGDPSQGYYSYDLGTWHIVALNSIYDSTQPVSVAAGSTQEQWLRADLAASRALCTVAYFHYPRFSSGGAHGSDPQMGAIWQA